MVKSMWEAVATGSDGASSHREAFIQKLKRAKIPHGVVGAIRWLIAGCAFEQHNGEFLPLPVRIFEETAWRAYQTLQNNNLKSESDIPAPLLRRAHVPEEVIAQLRSCIRGVMPDPVSPLSTTLYVRGFGVADVRSERPIPRPAPPPNIAAPAPPQRTVEAEIFPASPPLGVKEIQEEQPRQPAPPKKDKLKKEPESPPTPTEDVSIFPARRSKTKWTLAQRKFARGQRRSRNGDLEELTQQPVEQEPPHITIVRKHLHKKRLWTSAEVDEILRHAGIEVLERGRDWKVGREGATHTLPGAAVKASEFLNFTILQIILKLGDTNTLYAWIKEQQ